MLKGNLKRIYEENGNKLPLSPYNINFVSEDGELYCYDCAQQLIDDEYIIDVSEESSFDVMTDETQLGDNFVKLDIVYQSVFYIDYDYNGIQEETIYFVLYKEVYNTETQKYELQLVFPELLVTNGESFVWSSVLSSGTYYIGYYNKLNTQSTISIGIGA